MAQVVAGTVAELWRYPVKSMLGETREAVAVTEQGLAGDRAWALRNLRTGNVVSAKKWPRMFEFRAWYEQEPTPDDSGQVRIELPGGDVIGAEDPWASRAISESLGLEVRLERRGSANQHQAADIDPQTVFGDVPVHTLMTQLAPGQILPDTFNLPRGSFFDQAAIHLVATSTLDHLHQLKGDDSMFVTRRFRPNVLVKTAAFEGFIEDDWLQGTLAVDGIQIDRLRPTLRCVMTTHPQGELPRDMSILRSAAQLHGAYIGVTGRINGAATIRVGDPVLLTR